MYLLSMRHSIETRFVHPALKALPYPRLVNEGYGFYTVTNATPAEKENEFILTGGAELVVLGERNECSCEKPHCFHIEKAVQHRDAYEKAAK